MLSFASTMALIFKSLLIFPKGRDVLETGHAVSLQQSFPERSVKLGKGRGQGFLDGLCILGQHSINVDTLGKTHCANVFVSLGPESDFASQLLACSTKLVGEIYQSKLYEERGFWETD